MIANFRLQQPNLPDREKWYRLPEREKTNLRKRDVKPFPYGSWVRSERLIVRVGYYWQPADMPHDLLQERIMAHLCNWSNASLASGEDLSWQIALHDSSFLSYKQPVEGVVTPQVINAVLSGIDTCPEKILSHLIYRLRGDWLNEQHCVDKNLRTTWYVDWPDGVGQVEDIRVVKIGERIIFGDWDGEYDPPYFSQLSSQALFRCGPYYLHQDDILDRSVQWPKYSLPAF